MDCRLIYYFLFIVILILLCYSGYQLLYNKEYYKHQEINRNDDTSNVSPKKIVPNKKLNILVVMGPESVKEHPFSLPHPESGMELFKNFENILGNVKSDVARNEIRKDHKNDLFGGVANNEFNSISSDHESTKPENIKYEDNNRRNVYVDRNSNAKRSGILEDRIGMNRLSLIRNNITY